MARTVKTLITLMRRDSRYWQFPAALAILTTGSISLSERVYDVHLPWWLVLVVKLWFAVVSVLVAWWLLLGAQRKHPD